MKRKRRRSAASRVILSLFILALFGSIAAGALAFYGYQEYSLPGPLAEKKVFEIQKGLSTPEIASKLADAGIITAFSGFDCVMRTVANCPGFSRPSPFGTSASTVSVRAC